MNFIQQQKLNSHILFLTEEESDEGCEIVKVFIQNEVNVLRNNAEVRGKHLDYLSHFLTIVERLA